MAAAEAGNRPETRVSSTLMTIITTALYHCREHNPAMPVSGVRIG